MIIHVIQVTDTFYNNPINAIKNLYTNVFNTLPTRNNLDNSTDDVSYTRMKKEVMDFDNSDRVITRGDITTFFYFLISSY